MSKQVFDYLASARKEAERHLFDVDRRISELEREISLAREESAAFKFLIADFTNKMRSLPRVGSDSKGGVSGRVPHNALAGATNDQQYHRMMNMLAHGLASDDRKPTIKEMLISVLSMSPDGLDVGEIMRDIRHAFNVEVPRTSLSPQLSRMKSEEDIDLIGDKWVIAKRRDAVGGDRIIPY